MTITYNYNYRTITITPVRSYRSVWFCSSGGRCDRSGNRWWSLAVLWKRCINSVRSVYWSRNRDRTFLVIRPSELSLDFDGTSSRWRRFTPESHDFCPSAGVVRWSALVLSCGSLTSFCERNVVFCLYPLHPIFKYPFWTLVTKGSVITGAVGAFRFVAARTAVVSSLSAWRRFLFLYMFFGRGQISGS